MIQTFEDMMRMVFDYGLELKNSDGLTYYWYTLIPESELAYKTSVHASTGNNPAMLERGWNPNILVDNLKKYLIGIHPAALRFELLLDKVRHLAKQSMTDALEYANQKDDKGHITWEFKAGDLIIVSTLKFENMKGPKKLKYSFEGTFIIKALH
ncbi:hypothetical protein O181_039459 [Austropuccinia psidii MF-1]|uniref:Uncharacterized protein n=1 Tax=Austropuccinia psidii MF-1 TaxID=1389203 RepID=A0A9Q3DAD4_9BASI|nr:hypothetical protein [Austropuccinia psidii MF-1]